MPAASDKSRQLPRAPKVPHVRQLHGDTDTDDYAWMRDPGSPELREYLAAERAHYDAAHREVADLAAALRQEAVDRVPDETQDSVAWHLSDFVYRTRTLQGRENLQFLRSQSGESGEEVLLDENIAAGDSGYIEVGVREVSPDQNLLAWSADLTGAEIYTLRIRDLRTGADLPDLIERSYTGAAWDKAGEHLYYLYPDEVNRPFQVRRHRVGTDAAADVVVFTERDARFEVTLHASRSGEHAIVTSASRDTTEVWLIPLAGAPAAPALVRPRQRGTEYRVDHAVGPDGGSLYIVTDDGEPEFTLMRAPASAPGRENWQPVPCPAIAPAQRSTRLLRCDVFAGHLLLSVRRDGQPALVIARHDGSVVATVSPAFEAGRIAVEHAEEYRADSVIVVEESLIEPPAWYRLDLRSGERDPLLRRQVPGYDAARYRTIRREAPARDGTAIPVTLACHKDTPLDGSAPCLLYGYGAYESVSDPEFDVSLPSLLDRGVVYAIAHVRGGGERGRHWWQQGRLHSKPTTFTDFIDVADWLAGDAGQPALVDGTAIVSRGLSAGGLLQGAAFSMRPDRWRAVVAEVPFVDVVSSMLDETIPLTVNEWDEWGDPRDPADYAVMRSYSPYENPPPGRRPPMLVTGAVHDPRVGVHEPAKWVARLRATDTAASRLLFRVELGAGAHTGPSGRYGKIGYEAEVQAFIANEMGLAE